MELFRRARSSSAGSLTTLLDRRVRRRVRRSGVLGARPDEPVVVMLLDDVRATAGDAADSEDRREEIDVDAERRVGGRGVKVDVRVQLFLVLHEELNLA